MSANTTTYNDSPATSPISSATASAASESSSVPISISSAITLSAPTQTESSTPITAPSFTPDNPTHDKNSHFKGGLEIIGKYFGVSATQTIVEFAVFFILNIIGIGSQLANSIAIVCSAIYNFVMNRNITFNSSSNFARSVVLFILLWIWNFLFSNTMLYYLPDTFKADPTFVKLGTMCCQGIWGYLLCKNVIFR